MDDKLNPTPVKVKPETIKNFSKQFLTGLAAFSALLSTQANAQTNKMSPQIAQQWEQKTQDAKAHQDDVYQCLLPNHDHSTHADSDHDNLDTRNAMYTDCDTVRVYDLIVDDKERKDKGEFEYLIDSMYAAEGRKRKHLGKTVVPVTDDVAKRAMNNTVMAMHSDAMYFFRNNVRDSLPPLIQEALTYILETYRPDIINITVPGFVSGGATMGPNWSTGNPVYSNQVNVTVISNTQWDSDDVEKQKRYYWLKLHEEGHLQGKQHPDKSSPCPGRVADPNWKGYMASSLWWDVTLEDTQMNLDNSLKATPLFLKQNEKRESDCTVSLANPDLNEVEISLFPNPASTSITIHNPDNLINIPKVSITDMMGNTQKAGMQEDNTINLQHLPGGVYFIQLPLKNGKMKVVRIVKV